MQRDWDHDDGHCLHEPVRSVDRIWTASSQLRVDITHTAPMLGLTKRCQKLPSREAQAYQPLNRSLYAVALALDQPQANDPSAQIEGIWPRPKLPMFGYFAP